MNNIVLNNGLKMPVIGFGVYQVTNLTECTESVLNALETGYRLIDTASAYMNEQAVGEAIKKSALKREDLFITTKLWIQDAGYEQTKNAFYKSLKRLRLDYLDLYLIHQPFGDYYGSYRAMEELYRERLVKSIGVSNFYPDRLLDLILHNEIVPMVNQVETHPFCQQIESGKIMKEYKVGVQSWAPFAEGKNDIFKNETLTAIGKKYNKSAAQVILRWLIQRGIAVIPKSTHKERIKENFDIFNFELKEDDMKSILSLDMKKSLFLSHTDTEVVKWLSGVKYDI